ncbi:hypothetical protein [uncultured Demequina sp.]|uniref:hypothetical protein n=1 Tax=uncultured Demequina sp. TaxID=693499 RepID=UPI0025E2F002|nr:hypothetical protein [uncultured Demequina sp.]
MNVALHSDTRTYFHTLDGAMADFALSLGAVDRVRDAVRGLDFEHVFIPGTRDYIALEAADAGEPVAYITPTFVALHPRGGSSSFVEIAAPEPVAPPEPAPAAKPARASAGRKAAAKASEPAVALCPTCFVGLPATGVCDFCG